MQGGGDSGSMYMTAMFASRFSPLAYLSHGNLSVDCLCSHKDGDPGDMCHYVLGSMGGVLLPIAVVAYVVQCPREAAT